MSDSKAKAERLVRKLTGNGCQCYLCRAGREGFTPVLEQCYEALTIGKNYLLGSLEEYRDAGEDDCSLAIGIRKALHEVNAALTLFELPGVEEE